MTEPDKPAIGSLGRDADWTDGSTMLLARLLEAIEQEGPVAEERLRAQDAAAYERLRPLVMHLRGGGMLRERSRIGRFVLEAPLGRGAMGMVFRAHDPVLQRQVAVKIVAAPLLASPVAAVRFHREARLIASLRHPGIVTVHEVGEDDGVPYLVMELVDGGTLADRLSRDGSHPLGQVAACRLGSLLCEALDTSHAAGVIHRDIKPSNILLRSSGGPLLADFGLACNDGDPSITVPGDLLGTPAYGAPELLVHGRGDARSDVYSLAATLFHALTGRPPFVAKSLQALLLELSTSTAPRLRRLRPDLSQDLECVFECALNRDPVRRYPTASAFGEDLGRVLLGEPVRARRTHVLSRICGWVRRRPWQAAAVGVPVFLAVLFTSGFLWWQKSQLDQYNQLADVRVAANLSSQFGELWPADAATAVSMRRWLDRARAVIAREDAHAAVRARIDEQRAEQNGDQAPAGDTAAWQHEVLGELLAGIGRLKVLVPLLEARAHVAETVEEVTSSSDTARRAWADAIDAIRRSPRYDGLEIRPQPGLLPLGEDPATGLWEFWHYPTGDRPLAAESDAPSRWRIEPETGLVFVLLPGGNFSVGYLVPSHDHPVGSPFVEPLGRKIPWWFERVRLDPWLFSKYEITQSQWERLTGKRPSLWDHRKRPDIAAATAPVENVTWTDATAVLVRVGLGLPSDAQWEVAYRAGSATVFPTGPDGEGLFGLGNVCDRSWQRGAGAPDSDVEPFDDGFQVLAPVGSFPSNGFGLHDMIGNVSELCADQYGGEPFPARPGDGLSETTRGGRFRFVRGASWADRLDRARSSQRDLAVDSRPRESVGVRPVRRLDR